MLHPMMLPDCGHTYCKSCVLRILEEGRDQGQSMHCPKCRRKIESATVTNYTVKTLVEKVRAKCNRCDAKEQIEVLLRHKCPEEEVKCPNKDCQATVKRKEKETHAEECLYKIISCDRCDQDTTVANQEVHRDQICPEGATACPLKCTSRPKRYDKM